MYMPVNKKWETHFRPMKMLPGVKSTGGKHTSVRGESHIGATTAVILCFSDIRDVISINQHHSKSINHNVLIGGCKKIERQVYLGPIKVI